MKVILGGQRHALCLLEQRSMLHCSRLICSCCLRLRSGRSSSSGSAYPHLQQASQGVLLRQLTRVLAASIRHIRLRGILREAGVALLRRPCRGPCGAWVRPLQVPPRH